MSTKKLDRVICIANGVSPTTFDIYRSITDTFIQHRLMSACLASSALCVEMLNKHGIDAKLMFGWMLPPRGDGPQIAIRHVWFQSGGKHMDPTADIALILCGIPKMRVASGTLPEHIEVFLGDTPEEIHDSLELERNIQAFQTNPSADVEFWKVAPEHMKVIRKQAMRAIRLSLKWKK